jgi:leucyl aminopeptidase (aminopeptidase T)
MARPKDKKTMQWWKSIPTMSGSVSMQTGSQRWGVEMSDPGLATDAGGNPVIDPTKNVEKLVEAAIKRQDDLREAESRHVRELIAVRAEYATDYRRAETERINAIRQVDVEAVQRAAEVQATAQNVLANQVAASAEAMRAQVAAAAEAAAGALSKSLEPIQKDIQDLRKAQYEAQGQKTQIVETRATGASAGLWIGLAVGGMGLLLSVILAAVAIVVALP